MEKLKKGPFLLFLDPKGQPSSEPIIDEYTRKMTAILNKSTSGIGYDPIDKDYTEQPTAKASFHTGSSFKGFHCFGKKASSSKDYLIFSSDGYGIELWNGSLVYGFITNSLCIHYLAFYRKEVPQWMLEIIEGFDEQVDPTSDQL